MDNGYRPLGDLDTMTSRRNDKISFDQYGQSIIEFCFAMVVVILLIYGLVMVIRWVGMDLADRRIAHDRVLISGGTPEEQVRENFYRPRKINVRASPDMMFNTESMPHGY